VGEVLHKNLYCDTDHT